MIRELTQNETVLRRAMIINMMLFNTLHTLHIHIKYKTLNDQKMELTTTFIGLLILLLFMLPVYFLAKTGKANAKKIEKDFFSEIARNELSITEKDIWNDYAIGIDTVGKKVIYFDGSGPESNTSIIDLKNIKAFESFPSLKEINRKGFNYRNAARLGLKFSFKDSAKKEINIVFFISGFGQQSEKDVRLFEKWMNLIMKNMSSI